MAKFLVMVALLSGCSLTFQSKPRAGQARAQSGCSTGRAWWIADAAIAASTAAGTAVAYVATTDTEHSDIGMAAAGTAAIAAVVYLASASNGRSWRNDCVADNVTQTAAR